MSEDVEHEYVDPRSQDEQMDRFLRASGERQDRLARELAEARADLACALPVVEAAGAVVEKSSWTSHLPPCAFDCLGCRLDALARAYRAAREPRTGEQG